VKRFVTAAVLLAAMGVAPAGAQFAKPEAAVEYRQSAFTLMGNHMGRIKGQLDYGKPSLDVIRGSAALLDVLKNLPFEAFVEGSSDAGDTAAKSEIWT